MTALTLDRVSKSFGRFTAVRPVSLTVPSGAWCVIVGPNGSGKTTLLQLASGLQSPTAGEVRIGNTAAGRPAARAAVSYLSDSPAFYSDLSVSEHFDYLAGLFHDPGVVDRAIRIIEQFDLVDRITDTPETFSRGMKQKTAIALALARPSSLLLLDEPTRGLDAQGTETMVRLLHEANRNGTTVVIVTHEPERFADASGLQLRVRDGEFDVQDGA